ncbi:MAG: hypothetical protein ACO23R_02605 [bacterium]
MIESLLGGLMGGVFRIVPEFLKLFDRKNERAHELAMLNAEMEFAKLRGQIVEKQTQAVMTAAELSAMEQAFIEQGKTAAKAGKFVSAVSALVRPIVTYWFVTLYSLVKSATFSIAMAQGGRWQDVVLSIWSDDDMGILTLILTFWFVGRVWERQKP